MLSFFIIRGTRSESQKRFSQSRDWSDTPWILLSLTDEWWWWLMTPLLGWFGILCVWYTVVCDDTNTIRYSSRSVSRHSGTGTFMLLCLRHSSATAPVCTTYSMWLVYSNLYTGITCSASCGAKQGELYSSTAVQQYRNSSDKRTYIRTLVVIINCDSKSVRTDRVVMSRFLLRNVMLMDCQLTTIVQSSWQSDDNRQSTIQYLTSHWSDQLQVQGEIHECCPVSVPWRRS
jgi:hypothetical protein